MQVLAGVGPGPHSTMSKADVKDWYHQGGLDFDAHGTMHTIHA